MLQWIELHIFHFKSCASIFVSEFLEVDFLGQKLYALVILIDTVNLPTKRLHQFTYPHPRNVWRFLKLHTLHHTVFTSFFILVSLTGEMVSHFIFMNEHLLVCFNGICISFPIKCLFVSFAHFNIGLWVIYWFIGALHVFGKWALCEIRRKYFPQVFIYF